MCAVFSCSLAKDCAKSAAKKRKKEITALCKQIEKEEGFAIRCQMVEEDERKAIERFEQAQTEDMA